jgi:hypothetical protein
MVAVCFNKIGFASPTEADDGGVRSGARKKRTKTPTTFVTYNPAVQN